MKSRTSNRAKQVSGSCGNNGSCPRCTGDRLYSSEKQLQDERRLNDLANILEAIDDAVIDVKVDRLVRRGLKQIRAWLDETSRGDE